MLRQLRPLALGLFRPWLILSSPLLPTPHSPLPSTCSVQFLVFQLSINLVAMISAAVGALYGGVPPLNVLQLLWVNMIM